MLAKLSLLLALWGALLSSGLGLVEMIRFRQDRPQIQLHGLPSVGGDCVVVGFDVVNVGRQPITLVEAEFNAPSGGRSMFDVGGQIPYFNEDARQWNYGVRLLQPAEVARYRLAINSETYFALRTWVDRKSLVSVYATSATGERWRLEDAPVGALLSVYDNISLARRPTTKKELADCARP